MAFLDIFALIVLLVLLGRIARAQNPPRAQDPLSNVHLYKYDMTHF